MAEGVGYVLYVKIKGGLGNQIFQYLFARYLQETTNLKIGLDLSAYKERPDQYKLSSFNICELEVNTNSSKIVNIIRRVISRFGLNRLANMAGYFTEIDTLDKFYKHSSRGIIEGYWQHDNEKYIKQVSTFREELRYLGELNEINQKIMDKMRNQNSVCVHFRRGDYTNKKNIEIFNQLDASYYKKAMDIISNKLENPIFYIFSDDIEWVKKNVSAQYAIQYIDHTSTDLEDFQLMRACNNFIIANSTFSWWAAWLSECENKTIIAPKKWFNTHKIDWEIVSNNWIKI